MDKIKCTKAALIIAFGALSSVFGNLTVPILIMVGANVLDYITAIIAAPKRGQKISSAAGIRGIRKKVVMWILVMVAALLDQLVVYATASLSISIPVDFAIACIVTIWICVNEIISILENIQDIIGEENIPPFLLPLVKNLKKQVADKVPKEVKEHKGAEEAAENE